MGGLVGLWLIFACPACTALIEQELSDRKVASGGADGSGGSGAKVDGAGGQTSTDTGSTTTTSTDTGSTTTTSTDTGSTTTTSTTTSSTGECVESADCGLSHATAVCSMGTCEIVSCSNDFADCNGDPADGCEADLEKDERHCGECQTECADDKQCKKGKCK